MYKLLKFGFIMRATLVEIGIYFMTQRYYCRATFCTDIYNADDVFWLSKQSEIHGDTPWFLSVHIRLYDPIAPTCPWEMTGWRLPVVSVPFESNRQPKTGPPRVCPCALTRPPLTFAFAFSCSNIARLRPLLRNRGSGQK